MVFSRKPLRLPHHELDLWVPKTWCITSSDHLILVDEATQPITTPNLA